MATIKDRLSTKTTPGFFKKLKSWAITASAILGSVAGLATKLPFVPPAIQAICDVASPLLLAAAGLSHMTIPQDLDKIKRIIPLIAKLFKKK